MVLLAITSIYIWGQNLADPKPFECNGISEIHVALFINTDTADRQADRQTNRPQTHWPISPCPWKLGSDNTAVAYWPGQPAVRLSVWVHEDPFKCQTVTEGWPPVFTASSLPSPALQAVKTNTCSSVRHRRKIQVLIEPPISNKHRLSGAQGRIYLCVASSPPV